MTVFVRRLTRLERCLPPIVLPDPCRQSQVSALLELSPAELETLEAMLVRGASGNSLSDVEQAAMDRYQEAFVATQSNAPQFGKEYAWTWAPKKKAAKALASAASRHLAVAGNQAGSE